MHNTDKEVMMYVHDTCMTVAPMCFILTGHCISLIVLFCVMVTIVLFCVMVTLILFCVRSLSFCSVLWSLVLFCVMVTLVLFCVVVTHFVLCYGHSFCSVL